MEPAYRYRVEEVLDVHDGDTFRARIDLGFRTYTVISIRVRGVNTPEMHDKDPALKLAARAAQRFSEETLKGNPVVIESHKDVQSFSRWVCDVWAGDRKLDEAIIEAGHGVFMGDPK